MFNGPFPTWADRWITPVPDYDVIRAFSVHPRFVRRADWPIDDNLDANLNVALTEGHSIICLYCTKFNTSFALPYVWTAYYAAHLPSLTEVLKSMAKEEVTKNKP